jgi:hypothetical protein
VSDFVHFDPVKGLEWELVAQNAALRAHESRLNDYGARMARIEIERIQEAINRRLISRGQAPRYVGVGVEIFGQEQLPLQPTRPMQNDFHDWNHESEDDRR